MKYIIGSGWWCSQEHDEREKLYGSDTIRGLTFHNNWFESIKNNSNPEKICIIDSDSPIKPDYQPDIAFITLNENGGHATNMTGKYSGWMRSVLLSMAYAQNCKCDYYVYVEQDVLLKGHGIIEHCISNMKKPYMFGKCNSFHNPLQQFFFIIQKAHIDLFLAKIYLIGQSDMQISPEKKFALATSPFFNFIPKFIFVSPKSKVLRKIFWRLQNILAKLLGSYDYLPVGFGRDRPLDQTRTFYYFQHGTKSEINEYYNS